MHSSVSQTCWNYAAANATNDDWSDCESTRHQLQSFSLFALSAAYCSPEKKNLHASRSNAMQQVI